MPESKVWFIPVTPAGTPVIYGAANRAGKINAARTEEEAWRNLMEDAKHMPYVNKQAFIDRGYTVERWEGFEP